MARVLSGVVLAAAFFAIIWFSSANVLLFVALGVAALAVYEYSKIAAGMGLPIPFVPTLVVTGGALAVVPYPFIAVEALLVIGVMFLAVVAMAGLKSRPEAEESGTSVSRAESSEVPPAQVSFRRTASEVAAASLAPVYIGLPLGTMVGLHIVGGPRGVLLLILTIVASDTAQYYSGRLLGRHLLAPRLSPKKTIEGAIGGLLVGPAVMASAGYYFVPAATNPWALAGVGVPVVVAGIIGDLFESMLKRGAGLKDSSTLIPGHGGVLDRIDAMLFATPVFYLYLRAVYTP